MSKELWIKAAEELEAELDREPTAEEIDERAIDLESSAIDHAMDLYEDGWL